MQERILKQESGIRFRKSLLLLQRPKGDLILTLQQLSFSKKEKPLLEIPLTAITNTRAKKGFGAGEELLIVSYQENGKKKEAIFEHRTLTGFAMGSLSRLQTLYFASWEQAIEDARQGKTTSAGSLDELEKLADLKTKGIISDEEFKAKKKQLLNL